MNLPVALMLFASTNCLRAHSEDNYFYGFVVNFKKKKSAVLLLETAVVITSLTTSRGHGRGER